MRRANEGHVARGADELGKVEYPPSRARERDAN